MKCQSQLFTLKLNISIEEVNDLPGWWWPDSLTTSELLHHNWYCQELLLTLSGTIISGSATNTGSRIGTEKVPNSNQTTTMVDGTLAHLDDKESWPGRDRVRLTMNWSSGNVVRSAFRVLTFNDDWLAITMNRRHKLTQLLKRCFWAFATFPWQYLSLQLTQLVASSFLISARILFTIFSIANHVIITTVSITSVSTCRHFK